MFTFYLHSEVLGTTHKIFQCYHPGISCLLQCKISVDLFNFIFSCELKPDKLYGAFQKGKSLNF